MKKRFVRNEDMGVSNDDYDHVVFYISIYVTVVVT